MTDPVPATRHERWRTLRQLEEWLRAPMLVLSVLWLVLVFVELTRGSSDLLETFGTAIWVIFIVEFALRFTIAPGKLTFLKRNWITLIALVAPALRLLRIVRVARAAAALRGMRLVRIVGAANRGMNALRKTLVRRRLGYVLGLTTVVGLLGAAGMLSFEPASEIPGGFASYGDALWWTGMLFTSIGSQYWPVTAEGRILGFLLSLYGFAVFGYITAAFASFFVGRDAQSSEGDVAGSSDLAALRQEIAALHTDLLRAMPRDNSALEQENQPTSAPCR
ncbi:MAG TPA: ion transporter [Sphingomonas sp.]|nr:ion transporter [Sphingomonas sp.]